MKHIAYFPGCTHNTNGRNMESSGKAVLETLGYQLEEMPEWICCGTVFGLSEDDLFHQVAPIRNLARVENAGDDTLITMCAMCYNTLGRANLLVRKNEVALEALNRFMDDEPDYHGKVDVIHLTQFLKDEVGFDEISSKVKRPLAGLKVMPYYGCLLLRPEEVSIDNMEDPTIICELLESVGIQSIKGSYISQCCGSYHTVDKKEAVARRASEIISSARKRGADMIALACPLCEFNLDDRQRLLSNNGMPVLYFTELLALAFGLKDSCDFDEHYVDPRPLLREKGLLGGSNGQE